jgi:ribosome-associated protein YbcJ (S4-like RNA binding protein)
MKEITLRQEFITLGQLLKYVGEVNSGGDVKDYLAVETPLVNGEEEIRRGRKLRAGDVIVLRGSGELHIKAPS